MAAKGPLQRQLQRVRSEATLTGPLVTRDEHLGWLDVSVDHPLDPMAILGIPAPYLQSSSDQASLLARDPLVMGTIAALRPFSVVRMKFGAIVPLHRPPSRRQIEALTSMFWMAVPSVSVPLTTAPAWHEY